MPAYPTPLSCFDGSRCSACDGSHRCVPGDGPIPCSVMSIGERPGGDEEISGRPFSGRSGEEFNYGYLALAGLTRDDIYVSNVTKCGSKGNRKPNKAEISECSRKFLPIELAACQPEIILLMGSTACSLVPDIQIGRDHGILQQVWLMGEKRWIYPVYHPAAGLHNTSLMSPLLEDFEELGRILRGNYSPLVDLHPDRQYSELFTVDEIDQTFDRHDPDTRLHVGLDTEADGPRLFSAQYSTSPDNGYFIRGTRPELLARLGTRLRDHIAVIHNDLYDLDPLAAVNIPIHRVIDTMKIAYHLGNLPQGLKPLAWRLCGIKMRSYEDVVRPHSRRVMVQWLRHALDIVGREARIEIDMYKKPLKYDPVKHAGEEYSLVTRDGQGYRVGKVRRVEPELSKVLTRVITHTEKPIDDDAKTIYNPWNKLLELAPDNPTKQRELRAALDLVIKELGDPPIESIIHVPDAEAIEYACSDANACPRVLDELNKRCAKLSELVVESDYDT